MSFIIRLLSSAGGAVVLPAFIAVILFWEVVVVGLTSPNASLIVKLYNTLGHGHAEMIGVRTETSATYEHEMRLAVAEVERVTNAYNQLWQTYNKAVGTAINWETKLVDRQIETIRGTQWVPQIITNIASIGCVMKPAAQDAESAAAYNEACKYSQETREDMVSQYSDILPRYRTNMTQEMIESFPPPAELLSDEFERVADKYRSE
ncbi:MAG: hypothetical protein AAFR21_16830 [Pseudomonadota bacterium]